MSAALPVGNQCIVPSPCDPQIVDIPGAPGSPGTDGNSGSNGISAFTITTASFVMPAEGGNVTVPVLSSAWMVVGEPLFVLVAGTFKVVAIPDGISVTLKNLKDTSASAYMGNAAPTTVISASSGVTPTGFQGSGGGSGVPGGWLSGIGPPVNPPPDTSITWAYYDTDAKSITIWNVALGAWDL